MTELVAVLLTWISLQLGVQAPAPPDITFVSQPQLVEKAYGPGAPADACLTALYDRLARTIYLDTAWQRDELRDRSTLLHELVHHVQESSAMSYPCLAARERDAYHLQAEWLRQQGTADPYRLLGIDEFTIIVMSICQDD